MGWFDSASTARSARELIARYGTPEAMFRPSSGQTFAGVLVCLLGAVAGLGIAILGTGLDLTNRLCGAALGIGALLGAYWIYRLRRWCLLIFTSGIVQMSAWSITGLAWEEIHGLLDTRLGSEEGQTVRITLLGPGRNIVVRPINLRARKNLFQTLLNVAKQRQIPIHIEAEHSSD